MTSSQSVPVSMQRQASGAKTALQRVCRLDIDSTPATAKNTAIMCTLGPATRDPETLADMLEAGMGLARIHLAHTCVQEVRASLKLLAEAERIRAERSGAAARTPLGIVLDIRGRQIRTGLVDAGLDSVAMATGSRVRVHYGPTPVAATAEKLWIDFAEFAKVAKPDQVVSIDDGLLQLRVTAAVPGEAAVDCQVEIGGSLGPRRSTWLPGVDTGLPDLSQRDLEDLAALARDKETAESVGIVMAPFVSSAETIRRIRVAVVAAGAPVPLVVAKIGDLRGLRAVDEIIAEADAVLVARGDLGAELPLQKVFAVQKRIIALCSLAGKASICSSQLLDSMLTKPRPTRAEASDVANAVIDGADCLMLSSVTAVGSFPVQAVQTLAKICREAEAAGQAEQRSTSGIRLHLAGLANPLGGSAVAACEAAVRCRAAAILVVTDNPGLTRIVSMHRPPCPIVGICPDADLCRGLNLWYGVRPLHYHKEPKHNRLTEATSRLRVAAAYAHSSGLLNPSDLVVILVEKQEKNLSDMLTILTAVRLMTWRGVGVGVEMSVDQQDDDREDERETEQDNEPE